MSPQICLCLKQKTYSRHSPMRVLNVCSLLNYELLIAHKHHHQKGQSEMTTTLRHRGHGVVT